MTQSLINRRQLLHHSADSNCQYSVVWQQRGNHHQGFFCSKPRGLSSNGLLLTFVTKAMATKSKPQTRLWEYTLAVLTEFTFLQRGISCEALKSSKMLSECHFISSCFLVPRCFLVEQNGGNRWTKRSLWWPVCLLACLLQQGNAFHLRASGLEEWRCLGNWRESHVVPVWSSFFHCQLSLC